MTIALVLALIMAALVAAVCVVAAGHYRARSRRLTADEQAADPDRVAALLKQALRVGRPPERMVRELELEMQRIRAVRAPIDVHPYVNIPIFDKVVVPSMGMLVGIFEQQLLFEKLKSESGRPRIRRLVPPMELRTCALLLTDLRASTRMIGFLDHVTSACILQQYTAMIHCIVESHQGRFGGFTGDGVLAHFGIDGDNLDVAVRHAADCASEIYTETDRFFADDVYETLLRDSITVLRPSSRTVVHGGNVMYGEIGGAMTVVGRQVVALFRAGDMKDVFEHCPIILSQFAYHHYRSPRSLRPIVVGRVLDPSLPPMTFYPCPHLVWAS